MLLSLDGTLFVQILNFAIFFALVNILFIRPVRTVIEERRAYINGVLSDEEKFVAERRQIEGRAEAKRAAARREADVQLARARLDAAAEADGIIAQCAAQAAGLIEQAQENVALEVAVIRQSETQIVADLAEMMLAKAIGAV